MNFKTIQDSDALQSLRNEIIIPKHNSITYSSIFQQVNNELEQVKADVSHIFDTISTDVNSEMKQEELLDTKLRSTFKHLKHSYKKISKLRDKNLKYQLQDDTSILSKHLYHMEKNLYKLENEFKDIKVISNNIIDNIITINDNFIKKNDIPVITLDNFNESQFPTLFKIIKQKNPNIITQQREESSNNRKYTDFDSSNVKNFPCMRDGNIDLGTYVLNIPNERKKLCKNDTGEATKYTTNDAIIFNSSFKVTNSKLIPPFLKMKPHPSTYTNLQNIHNDNNNKSSEDYRY